MEKLDELLRQYELHLKSEQEALAQELLFKQLYNDIREGILLPDMRDAVQKFRSWGHKADFNEAEGFACVGDKTISLFGKMLLRLKLREQHELHIWLWPNRVPVQGIYLVVNTREREFINRLIPLNTITHTFVQDVVCEIMQMTLKLS